MFVYIRSVCVLGKLLKKERLSINKVHTHTQISFFFQVYHYCHGDNRQDSFLCPKGTVFNQAVLVCDWWYNADCPNSERFYALNAPTPKVKKVKVSAEVQSVAKNLKKANSQSWGLPWLMDKDTHLRFNPHSNNFLKTLMFVMQISKKNLRRNNPVGRSQMLQRVFFLSYSGTETILSLVHNT